VVREGRNTGQLLAMLVTAPARRRRSTTSANAAGRRGGGRARGQRRRGRGHCRLAHTTLFGADEFEERIDGLTLRLSPGAFMQTNSEMSQVLYRHAIEQARLRPGDVAWDLYCGAGAIGLLAAPYVERVIGIELSSESVAPRPRERGRERRRQRRVREGDVAKQLRPLLERVPRPSVVFVDPPRAGLTPRAVRRVLELAPERISYVSCNPTTLAPNARQLVDGGYRLELVHPWTCSPTPTTSNALRSSPGRSRARSLDGPHPVQDLGRWATPSAIRGAGREK
jgi:23S rRNA (uracil1939-C5)-methyltransferase